MEEFKEFMRGYTSITPYMGRYKKTRRTSIIATFIGTIFELLIPVSLGLMIDGVSSNKPINQTLLIGVVMIIFAIISMLVSMRATKYAAITSTGFAANLRELQFRKIQTFAFDDIEHFGIPSLLTRITSDMQLASRSTFMTTRFLVRTMLTALLAFILSVVVSPRLSMIFLVSAPLLIFGIMYITSKSIPMFKQSRDQYDNLTMVAEENISNIRVVKSFVRESFEIKKFYKQNQGMFKLSDRANGIISLIFPMTNLIMFSTIAVIVWFGSKEIAKGNMTVGDLISFNMYSLQLLGAFIGMSTSFTVLMSASAGISRVSELVHYTPSMNNDEKIEELELEDGSVDFDNVSFSYDEDSDNYSLQDVNLHIKSGESIGIMGPTGSAKSSLVQLIPRLYDITEGSLRVGGHDIKEYPLKTLREEVAIVLQKNTLFSGTIKENIRWGDENATDEEIFKIAEIACVDEFVRERADGYDSILGQGGAGVSGGQKQRICIARSLLKKPKILILDNSTSAVDTKTEKRMIDNINEYSKNLTKIIISQRTSSFIDCDRIIMMKDGKINDIGSHEDLYKRNEVYRRIYDVQNKDRDIDE
ncbi:MAG: ABC transporter ATP-binding protein [Finegoldia sp.]|nr:ABC transporter ATP-binding protein [Finegoldia sp.]